MRIAKPIVELKHAEIMRRLEREIELNGSLRKAAANLGIAPQYLSSVLSGQRAIGPKLLKSLRLTRRIRKVVTYSHA